MANSFLQVRTNEEDKQKAGEILEELGTNLSTVVNMLIKQIIITKSIPFEAKINHSYTKNEMVSEVKATMAMEDMPLSDDEVNLLKQYQKATKKQRMNIRNSIIEEYAEK